jgi:hypothetical protein
MQSVLTPAVLPGALTIVLLVGMVLTRVFLLKRQGIKPMKFGTIDKTDFLILPFAFFHHEVRTLTQQPRATHRLRNLGGLIP